MAATDQPTENRLYTVNDVEALLRLGRSTVFELIRSGRLRSVKEGRARRITSAAIADYIAKLEQDAEKA